MNRRDFLGAPGAAGIRVGVARCASLGVAPLEEILDHNVLLFDFVLKRSLVNNGAGFARSVFETRPFFASPV